LAAKAAAKPADGTRPSNATRTTREAADATETPTEAATKTGAALSAHTGPASTIHRDQIVVVERAPATAGAEKQNHSAHHRQEAHGFQGDR
jgi:hypothetical protein